MLTKHVHGTGDLRSSSHAWVTQALYLGSCLHTPNQVFLHAKIVLVWAFVVPA